MFTTHKVQSIALPCRIEFYLRGVGRRYTADSSIELVTIIISIFISKPPFFFGKRESSHGGSSGNSALRLAAQIVEPEM